MHGGKYDEGTVFRRTLSRQLRTLHAFSGGRDGGHPDGLIDVDGAIHGATGRGGENDDGVILTMSLYGREDVIYNDVSDSGGAGGFMTVKDAFYVTFGASDGGFFRLTNRNDACCPKGIR